MAADNAGEAKIASKTDDRDRAVDLASDINNHLEVVKSKGKDARSLMVCPYFDLNEVHKVSRALLYALSTASVEQTAGTIFTQPASVVRLVKEEECEFLKKVTLQFNESPHESAKAVADEPYKVVVKLLESFVSNKRSFLGRISPWTTKDAKVELLMKQVEEEKLWPEEERIMMAQEILKHLDKSNTTYCGNKYMVIELYEAHLKECGFQPTACPHSGCLASFSAYAAAKHDAVCNLKPVPCLLACKEMICRREMTEHCATTCAMRIINCPFYPSGCHARHRQGDIGDHLEKFMLGHILLLQQAMLRQGQSIGESKQRLDLLEQGSTLTQRESDLKVKELELMLASPTKQLNVLKGDVRRLQGAVESSKVEVMDRIGVLEKKLWKSTDP